MLGEALRLRDTRVATADAVKTDQAEPGREPILLESHIETGPLTIVRPERDAELAAYVAFASELDDSEAMALAIAPSHGWQIATDDVELVRLQRATETVVWK